jgi:hypothetical protein
MGILQVARLIQACLSFSRQGVSLDRFFSRPRATTMLRTAPHFAIVLFLGSLAGTGHGQQQAPKTLDESGTVKGVVDGKIQFEASKGGMWWIQLNGDTKLRVEGTADSSYLRGGLAVRFTGEFDKKGTLSEEIKEIEIFTPQGKNALGLFSDANSDKPVRNAPAGSYDIRGKVKSFKDNDLVVSAGNKTISGKVVEGITIKINVEDVKDVSEGDKATVKATYFDAPQQPYGGNAAGNPRVAAGNEVEVTLANPLTGVKKKAAKPPKEKKEKKEKKTPAENASNETPAVQDLFGVDTPKADPPADEKPAKTAKKTTKKPAKPEMEDDSKE